MTFGMTPFAVADPVGVVVGGAVGADSGGVVGVVMVDEVAFVDPVVLVGDVPGVEPDPHRTPPAAATIANATNGSRPTPSLLVVRAATSIMPR
jgi:hypothetical protein